MLNRFQLPLVMFVIMITILWQGLSLNAQELPSSLLGKAIPKFSISSVEEPKSAVTEQIFKGHITIIQVWSSRCRACSRQHEILNELNLSGDLQLVGLNYKDSKDKANEWLHKLGNPYKVNIFDTDGRLSMDLGVYGTPSTYVIDKNGVIRYRHVGTLTKEMWFALIVPEINKLKG